MPRFLPCPRRTDRRSAVLQGCSNTGSREPIAPSRRRVAVDLLWPRLCLGIALLVALAATACNKDVAVIGLLEEDLSPRVDDTRNGFLESLAASGFKGGDTARFIRYNAESSKRSLDDLARALVEDGKARAIFASSPAGLQAAQAASGQAGALAVFALGGPDAAGEARRALERSNLVTGVAAPSLEGDAVNLVRHALPGVTRVAVLFDPAEAASQASASLFQAAAGRAGLTPLMVTLNARLGKTAALGAIDQGARAFYLVPGSSMEAAFPAIIEVANAGSIPVFSGDEGFADRGALATLQVDWEEIGRRAGERTARVLQGADIASVPVDYGGANRLVLNQDAARRLRVVLPADLVAAAARVVEG